MIQYKCGDILQEDAEALINTVNCVGIMGRGIAAQFKKAFPDNFKAYAAACKKGEVRPGNLFVFDRETLTNPRYIINFPTKQHWRGSSKIEYIDVGLRSLLEVIRRYGIHSIAIPPLGCGLGGLHWPDVKARIARALQTLPDVSVSVFEPSEVIWNTQVVSVPTEQKMTISFAVLICLIDRYLSAFLDPFITLLEVHKLMYFTQEAGEPLRLHYVAGPYGPYADNLRHVLQRAQGCVISGYRNNGDKPFQHLELIPGVTVEAREYLQDHAETHGHLDRVFDLVNGFETTLGIELLATVHWVAKGTQEPEHVIRRVQEWNERKRRLFNPEQIHLAFDTLREKGWLNFNGTRSEKT